MFGRGGGGRGRGGRGRGGAYTNPTYQAAGRGMKRAPPPANDGTGYGGQQGDTKRLVAGRKKAEKASAKDDKASIKFLKQISKQLSYQKKTASKGGESIDLDEDDRKKLSTLLADIFRNQVPTDWDQRKDCKFIIRIFIVNINTYEYMQPILVLNIL